MKAIESQAASKPQAGVTDAGSGETMARKTEKGGIFRNVHCTIMEKL